MANWKETKCGRCKIQRGKPICNTCERFNKFQPMSNADRIRNMTDEEMAEWIFKHDTITQCQGRLNTEELLAWLQTESEE